MVSTVHESLKRFVEFQKEQGVKEDVQRFGIHMILEGIFREVYGEKVEE